MPATLLAELPTVRSIAVGGSPTELRLPGAPEDAVYLRFSTAAGGFNVTPGPTPATLTLNGEPLPPGGAALHDGDLVAIQVSPSRAPGPAPAAAAPHTPPADADAPPEPDLHAPEPLARPAAPADGPVFELTFHAGPIAEDNELIDTPGRWKLPRRMLERGRPSESDDAAPHIKEFDLRIRAYLQVQDFDKVQALAEEEIQRALHLPEFDELEGYVRHLWLTRVRMARASRKSDAVEIARQAYDLFPESGEVMVACGTTFLAAEEWTAARDAFDRALRVGRNAPLMAMHDARAGRVLAEHMARYGGSWSPWSEKIATAPIDWSAAPRVKMHAPGDEAMLWRIGWYGYVFGEPKNIRFVYRGSGADDDDGDNKGVERWEVVDVERGRVWRAVLEVPPLTHADPSLAVEVAAIRSTIAQADSDFASKFVDFSQQDEPDEAPISIDSSVVEALLSAAGARPASTRLSSNAGRLTLSYDAAQSEDVVSEYGELSLAVSREVAESHAGSTLLATPATGLLLQRSDGKQEQVVAPPQVRRRIRAIVRPARAASLAHWQALAPVLIALLMILAWWLATVFGD